MSPEFQHQIERLLIHFVQRNRNFFGEQGRKRMSDIRMLISTSATSVVQGMRGHLTGQRQNNPPFGSPRPVFSWSTTNVTGHVERAWEQMLPATMLLQQQLQELRGEIPLAPQSEPQSPVAVAARRNIAPAASVQPATPAKATNGNRKSGNNGASQASMPEIPVHDAHHTIAPSVGNTPLPPVWQSVPASNPATLHAIDTAVTPVETPIVKPPVVPDAGVPRVAKVTPPEKNQSQVQVPSSPMPERIQAQATIQPSPVPTSSPSASSSMQAPPSPVSRRMPPAPSSTAMQSRNMSSNHNSACASFGFNIAIPTCCCLSNAKAPLSLSMRKISPSLNKCAINLSSGCVLRLSVREKTSRVKAHYNCLSCCANKTALMRPACKWSLPCSTSQIRSSKMVTPPCLITNRHSCSISFIAGVHSICVQTSSQEQSYRERDDVYFIDKTMHKNFVKNIETLKNTFFSSSSSVFIYGISISAT